MGKYINVVNGKILPDKGKAEFLLHNIPGTVLIGSEAPDQWQEDLVCVVDNGPFEAVAYAYDAQEMEHFKAPDQRPRQRPRRWLIVPNAKQYAK